MRVHAIVEKDKKLRTLEDIELKVGETIIINIEKNHLEEYRALQKRNEARNIRISPDINISALGNEINNEIL